MGADRREHLKKHRERITIRGLDFYLNMNETKKKEHTFLGTYADGICAGCRQKGVCIDVIGHPDMGGKGLGSTLCAFTCAPNLLQWAHNVSSGHPGRFADALHGLLRQIQPKVLGAE
jgi:hypothetical protein